MNSKSIAILAFLLLTGGIVIAEEADQGSVATKKVVA